MKSIIFNQYQVNHALKNEEGMFRVVVKPQPNSSINPVYLKEIDSWQWATKESRRKSRFQVGETIFVKETFCVVDDTEHGEGIWIDYRATPKYEASHPAGWDNEPDSPDALKWKSPVHMKQEHSRLTLRIKSVKVERLVDIDINGLEKEGLPEKYDAPCPASWFAKLWNSTRKKPEEKWEANPFVFCFSYEVVKIN